MIGYSWVMKMKEAHILLVDDEASIVQMVEMVMKKEGFENIYKATNGGDALNYVRTIPLDYIVLDVMLPDMNGFDLCVKIRDYTDVHILFLSAKVNDLDILTGFEKGGDDYVTKPFNPLEIVARMKAYLKRNDASKNSLPAPSNKKIHQFDRFTVDEEAGELLVKGKVVSCPAQVFLLLVYFCQHVNQILSKEQLFTAVWGYDHMVDDNTVMVHIRRIRERIEPNPSQPKYLLTVRGLGYKLVRGQEK